MAASQMRSLAAVMTAAGILGACGGGGSLEASSSGPTASSTDSGSTSSVSASTSSKASSLSSAASSSTATSTAAASSAAASASSSASSQAIALSTSTTSCAALALAAPDAATFTGDSTPLQTASYYRYDSSGTLNPKILPFQVIDGKYGYKYLAQSKDLVSWQFAGSDPTSGMLTSLECDVAPDLGWHSYARSSGTASTITHQKVIVTGGRNAAKENIYTVYNGQQFIAALNEAGLKPKIIRIVGHIDLRWSNNNTTFTEYISYTDQKYGGSINIPSNTTIVGINDANGNPARITGTTLLIGGELGTTTSVIAGANGDPENDFKKWIAAGLDGDLYPTWTRNIIMRNLRIDTPWDVDPEDSGNAYADGMTISRAQNIYLSNISMSDGDTPDSLGSDTRHDAAIDIVRGSDYVTLANTFIEKHHKTTLLGNGDSGRAWSDQNRLHATFTGMWWSGTESRLPLVRFGQLHSFNNLVEGDTEPADSNRKFAGGLDVRYQSDVLSENNYYQFTNLKPKAVGGKVSSGKDAISYRAYNEWFINDKDDNSKAWATSYNGAIDITAALLADPALPFLSNWTPPYSYTAKSPDAACTWIRSNAGAGSGSGRSYMPATMTCAALNTLVSSSSSSSSSTAASSSSTSAASSSAASTSSSASSSSSSGSTTVVTYPWSDDFNVATTATLFTTGYAALPTDATKAMYVKTGGSPAVTDGVITLTGARFTIGALSSTTTSATSTGPLGIFDIVGKNCTLTVNLAEPGSVTTTGKTFQVYVDNNTDKSANSPHSNSQVVKVDASTLTSGDNVFVFPAITTAGFTGGSFLQIRTETGATVKINSIGLNCI